MRASYTIYFREDTGSWWVNCSAGGKRIRKDTYVADRGSREAASGAAAQLYLEACAAVGAKPAEVARPELSTARVIEMYLEHVRGRVVRESLGEQYESGQRIDMDRIQRFMLNPLIANNENWKIAMDAMHDSGLSWGSIHRITASLRALLRYAVGLRVLAVEPLIRGPKKGLIRLTEKPKRAMTREEREAFLDDLALRGLERARRIYTILFFTALRGIELARLTPRWIQWDGMRPAWLKMPALRTKSKKEGQDLALAYRAAEALMLELSERAPIGMDEPIFGAFRFHETFWKSIDRLGIDRHGLVPHHSTRYTAITMVAEKATSIAEVRAVSRHETLEMVQHYMRSNAKLSEAGVNRID